MSDEDIRKAKRMTYRLYSLGERNGSRMSGELAQLLVGNVFFQNDVSGNIVKLCLEGADERTTVAPLAKSIRLFMQAREEIQRPFVGRSDCLQSSILDVLLCYISFWGQVFEYYETMYYKAVTLPDGATDQSPANVTFEIGWSITCLFIRDTMLSAAARLAGVAAGYDRSMSWYYYPANATSDLDEAKSLVLTVIAKIRKRGTVLVAAEGMLGHISFGNAIPLTHWVEDNLDKDWSNVERLSALSREYFESSSIRLNVNVTTTSSDHSEEVPSDESPLNSSFLDGIDEYSPTSTAVSFLSLSSRSVSLNVRPITPLLFGDPSCDWSGVDMLAFCRSVVDTCVWPEVANTVSTVGEIGISVLNFTAEVVQKEHRRLSVPTSPERPIQFGALLPFPTPLGLPNLEPLERPTPFIPIPSFTPTPQKQLPQFTPEPKNRRDSEITFFCSEDRPPLADTPTSFPPAAISCAPVPALPVEASVDVGAVAACLAAAARKGELTPKSWTLELALGDLATVCSVKALYDQIVVGENSGLGGNKRGHKDIVPSFPPINAEILADTESRLADLLRIVFARSLSGLSVGVRRQVGALARIIALAGLACGRKTSEAIAAAVAADFVCFANGFEPAIPPTDISATGLRGACATGHIALFEVAKDAGFTDWLSLSLFYNDIAYVLLLDPVSGLLNPTAPGRRRSQPPRALAPSVWGAFPDHCLLVGTELTLRWAWAPESRLWDVHANLVRDFGVRRHFAPSVPLQLTTATSELAELDYFLNLVLMNCSTYLIDLGVRLGVDPVVLHFAFDILRATILLRPTIIAGRHMYHLVYCSLMGAQGVLHPRESETVNFDRMLQAALIKESTKTGQVLINKYVFKSVSLSTTSGGNVGWANGAGPLILPNNLGVVPPEMALLGDVRAFYESIFVPELCQVFFALKVLVSSPSALEAGLGPAVRGLGKRHHSSLSPGAFPTISSALGIATQMVTGQANVQYKEMPYEDIVAAMPLVAPFGALACLRPPGTPFMQQAAKGERVYKWFANAAVLAASDGSISVVLDKFN